MSNHDLPLPTIRFQFRETAKALCKPYVHKDLSDKSGNPKSYAQVESFVRHQGGRQNSGGLKPGNSRPYRITTRFSEEERNTLVIYAENARLTLSQFVRYSLLKSPALDPARNRLLLKANYELTRQGTNLNQIARQLNAGALSHEQAESLLASLAPGMAQAYAALHEALANGRVAE